MNRKKCFAWLYVVIWMAVIFYFSAQTGESSGRMSGFVTKVIAIIFGKTTIADMMEFLVRKAAHMSEYAMLGILTYRAVRVQTDERGILPITHGVLSWGICVLYAASDEFHQSFIPGRSPQVTDVVIDSVGALAGIVIFIIGLKFSLTLSKGKDL